MSFLSGDSPWGCAEGWRIIDTKGGLHEAWNPHILYFRGYWVFDNNKRSDSAARNPAPYLFCQKYVVLVCVALLTSDKTILPLPTWDKVHVSCPRDITFLFMTYKNKEFSFWTVTSQIAIKMYQWLSRNHSILCFRFLKSNPGNWFPLVLCL